MINHPPSFINRKYPEPYLDGIVETADEAQRLTGGLPPGAGAACLLLRLRPLQQTQTEAGLPPEVLERRALTHTRASQGAGSWAGANLTQTKFGSETATQSSKKAQKGR